MALPRGAAMSWPASSMITARPVRPISSEPRKMGERIEGDVDAEKVKAPIRGAILGRCCEPGDPLAVKDVDAGPEQMVVCQRALIPRAGARIIGVRRIL